MLRVKIEAARDPVAHERKRKIVASLIAVSRAAPLQPIVRTERAPEPTPIVAQLADWIFARRGQDSSYDDLLKQAGKHERFRNEDFLAAFHCVYKTKRGNRPATGWPLQPDFQRRAAK